MPIVQECWLDFYIPFYFLPFHPKGSHRNRELCYSERGFNSERTQLFWPKDKEKRPLEARNYGGGDIERKEQELGIPNSVYKSIEVSDSLTSYA